MTCLGTFEYIEADREIYRKWITKSKQYSTTLHVRISDYFTYSIIICRYLFIILRYVTPRTLQKLTKEKNHLYYMKGTVGSIWPYCGVIWPYCEVHLTVLWGPFDRTVGSIWPYCGVYLTALWGPFDRTVGSIWPQAEININKKIERTDTKTRECAWRH
jgi:hypothetical protein